MNLHSLRRDVQRLRDVAVRLSGGSKIRHPPLARRECEDACKGGRARSGSGGIDLAANSVAERLRAADVGQLEGATQGLASVSRLMRMPEHAAQRRERLRLLEARRRLLQQNARLFELLESFRVQDCSQDTQRSSDGS